MVPDPARLRGVIGRVRPSWVRGQDFKDQTGIAPVPIIIRVAPGKSMQNFYFVVWGFHKSLFFKELGQKEKSFSFAAKRRKPRQKSIIIRVAEETQSKKDPKLPRSYPWKTWFARPKSILQRGKDFRCSVSSFVQQVRNAASHARLPVHVEEGEGGEVILTIEGKGKDHA